MSCLWIHSKSVAEPRSAGSQRLFRTSFILSLACEFAALGSHQSLSPEESSESFSNRGAPAKVRVVTQLPCHFSSSLA